MSHDYTERLMVEAPAFELLAELGWHVASAEHETFGETGTLGRASLSEVVLEPTLRAALRDLNPELDEHGISQVVDQLTRSRVGMPPARANAEVYELLKEGVPISVRDPKGGQQRVRARVIDWNDPRGNRFLAVAQMKIAGPLYSCIPDVIGFVNGLPLLVFEFKRPGVPDREAFDSNVTSYKHDLNGAPALWWYNAAILTSNGTESHIGSLTADWERFFEWKRVEREDEPRRVSLETLLRGVCEPGRFMDLVENFTLFSEHKAGLVKVLGQNHQFLGVNNAIDAAERARAEYSGRGGVFWHTQGSGKSFSMVFFSQKLLRKRPGNWTFVIVTDRVELDDQIATTYKACGAVSEAESKSCHAESGDHLRTLLRGNHRYVFTTIQKFQTDEKLSDRDDIIVLADEAHRTQFDTMAFNMRSALPNAIYLAYTGTPLMAEERHNVEIFGDYVSIYDFQMSVEDGATVRLYYENRTPELRLVNPELNDEIYDSIENADLDEEQQRRLEQLLGRQYHLITRDDRLETVAEDVVRHFLGRGLLGDGHPGKAMVVSIDKATALRMYDKVQKYWAREHRLVREALAKLQLAGRDDAELRTRLRVIESTEMAVIVSPEQNEIEKMATQGLDMVRHRERMHREPLDEHFKDPAHPLRLVFVCAMWLTGFDAPSCSTVYLDKPMRNHTLMQTIARANRVYPGKHSGVIVDYANVFLSLERALAIYGSGISGGRPVRDKSLLATALEEAIEETAAFCMGYGVSLEAIERTPSGSLVKLQLVEDAVNALIHPEDVRKEFLAHARYTLTLYNGIKPDPMAGHYAARASCIAAIADLIKARVNPNPVDVTAIMRKIGGILDDSIAGVGIVLERVKQVDLSQIDFVALREKFKKSPHKQSDLEQLKAAIKARLNRMLMLNPTRADFLSKFEELIATYNSGAAGIDELLEALLQLTLQLGDEERRHVRENLTEEELVIFDILTRPAPELSDRERSEVKKVARELLERIRAVLNLDWRSRVSSRSQVLICIESVLDAGLPEKYTPDVFETKVQALALHFNERYRDKDHNVYAAS